MKVMGIEVKPWMILAAGYLWSKHKAKEATSSAPVAAPAPGAAPAGIPTAAAKPAVQGRI